jgi:hypothetical protein
MSPAKLCPTHKKPYPCGRCRVENAAKPAQAAPQQQIPCSVGGCSEVYVARVGEFISEDFKFICKAHTPQNKHANTKGVPSSEITPEIRKKIEDQLMTAPSAVPESRITGEVETSIGTKITDIDTDDAADITDRSNGACQRP